MGGCVERKCEGFDGWVEWRPSVMDLVEGWRGIVRDLMDGWRGGEV